MKVGYLDLLGQLETTVELAPLADQLGWSRYWLTEFPPQPSPLTLCGVLAGLTSRIPIGTAAILFSLYAPRRTAYDFQLIERLYEGRIDAGLASSLASPVLMRDDLDGRDLDTLIRTYPERFATFLRHLRNTPGAPGYDATLAWPGAPELPPRVWSLGSSRAAELAAHHGTAFGYPLMYALSKDDPAVSLRYRDTYQATPLAPTPLSIVSIGGYAAATDDAAHAAAEKWAIFTPHVVGSFATVAGRLAELKTRYRADEIIFADMHRDPDARQRTIEGLAAAAATHIELRD